MLLPLSLYHVNNTSNVVGTQKYFSERGKREGKRDEEKKKRRRKMGEEEKQEEERKKEEKGEEMNL